MPRRKRQVKKQPEPAPEPTAKIKKRRRRRKPAVQPVVVTEPVPKTLMDRIFDAQKAELNRLSEALQKRVSEA
jgi:hypothetical protein